MEDTIATVEIGYVLARRAMRSFCKDERMKERLETLIKQERFYEAEGWKRAMEELKDMTEMERWDYLIKMGVEPL